MAAIAGPDMSEAFGRYRFWGLDPKAVERWAVTQENETADLRHQLAALETRAAEADTFAEEALIEAAALRETVARFEGEREDFTACQRTFRDEAAQIIHDARAEAGIVRAQAAAEIATTVERARDTLATELAAQQSQIAMLERRRTCLIDEIEASATNALNDIAPLKESVSRMHPDWQGDNDERDASRAVDDAMDALAELAATMQQSLSVPPSGGREPALNGSHPSSIGDSEMGM